MGSKIVVKCGKRTVFLQPELITWVEAKRDYVCLHHGSEMVLVRSTIQRMSEKLESFSFMRVHRSTMVNLNHVREMRPLESGDYEIIMDDSTRLLLSRGYRMRLNELLLRPVSRPH
jgi:two-component system LytT family response regulator